MTQTGATMGTLVFMAPEQNLAPEEPPLLVTYMQWVIIVFDAYQSESAELTGYPRGWIC